jgi:hypothetical protein
MNLQKAMKTVHKTIGHKQDPDHLTFLKQWSETGHLKGWIIGCHWGNLTVTLDITPHYTRVIGPLDVVRDYEKGKHIQYD